MQKSQFHGAFALNRRVDLHAMSTYRRRAQEAPRERRRHRGPVWGRRRRAAAEAEARRAARALRRATALGVSEGEEGEGRSLGGLRAEAEETLGYQVRTTNCLQGKIDELVGLCGEAERLSGLAQEAASTGDCDEAGRLAGAARDAVDSLKVNSIKYRTNR